MVEKQSEYGTKGLSGYGNYRVIQKVDNHNVHYVSNPVLSKGGLPPKTKHTNVVPTKPGAEKVAEKEGEKEEKGDNNEKIFTAMLVLMSLTLLVGFAILGVVCKNAQSTAINHAVANTSLVSEYQMK